MATAVVSPFLSGLQYALGQCTRGPVNSWNGARSATFSTSTSQLSNGGMQAKATPGGRGVGYEIKRTFVWYDLSTYTTGGNNISAISCNITPLVSTGTVVDAIVVQGKAFSLNTTSTISSADIANFVSTQVYSAPYSFPNSTTGFTVLLNATAIGTANSDTKLGLCHMTYAYDYLGADPYGGAAATNFLDVINLSAPQKMSLNITYAQTPTNWSNSMNGVLAADIGQVNGMNIGDIASINGIL